VFFPVAFLVDLGFTASKPSKASSNERGTRTGNGKIDRDRLRWQAEAAGVQV